MQCRKAYYREEEGIFVPWKNVGLMYIKSRAPRILFPIVLNIKNFRDMQSKNQIDSSIDISNRKTNNCVCLSSVVYLKQLLAAKVRATARVECPLDSVMH